MGRLHNIFLRQKEFINILIKERNMKHVDEIRYELKNRGEKITSRETSCILYMFLKRKIKNKQIKEE